MKRKALVAVVGVFLLGLLGGALLGSLHHAGHSWSRPWRGWHDGKHRGHAKHGSGGRYVRMLQRRLDLSDEQMSRIGPWLTRTRGDLYRARIRSLDEADRIILEFHQKIEPELDPEQAQKLDELTDDFRERRRKARRRMVDRLEALPQDAGTSERNPGTSNH